MKKIILIVLLVLLMPLVSSAKTVYVLRLFMS